MSKTRDKKSSRQTREAQVHRLALSRFTQLGKGKIGRWSAIACEVGVLVYWSLGRHTREGGSIYGTYSMYVSTLLLPCVPRGLSVLSVLPAFIACIPIIPFHPRGPATENLVPAPCQPGDAGLEAVKWVTTPQRTRTRLGGGRKVGPDRPSLMSGTLSLCRI